MNAETFGTLIVTILIDGPNHRLHRATLYRAHCITEDAARHALHELREMNKSIDWKLTSARFQPLPVDLTTY